MKITIATGRTNPYRSSKVNAKGEFPLVFVYNVSGTPEELAAYKASKAEHYREDTTTKVPLYFTQECIGKEAELIKSAKGQFFPDTSSMDTFASIEKRYGTTIAKEKIAEMK